MMKAYFFAALLIAGCTGSPKKAPAIEKGGALKQIQLESKGCYGTCPQFSLSILQDGTARYDARAHNERQGQFSTTIKQPQMDSLLALVDSAHYFSLKDNYPAMITDVVEYKSTLTLNDGTSKTITDQGPGGPAELTALYRFMLSLKTTQDWK